MVSAEYTLAELAAAAGMTERNVRAYRERGLVDAPRRHGRRGVYGPEHLAQLRRTRALVERGLTLNEVATALRDNASGEPAVELLVSEPADIRGADGGRLGALVSHAVRSLARQRPRAADRLVELGVIERDGEGRYLVDMGLMARANELLAEGTRVRVLADVGVAAASGAERVGRELVEIAQANGSGDPRRYVDLATWAFRQALRTALEQRPGLSEPRR
jgi:DNA-binding transcriptional MerR regulator